MREHTRPSSSAGVGSRHVVHVLRKLDPNEWGGTETHVAEVTRRLGPRGWRVEVHAPAGPSNASTGLATEVELVRYRSFLPVVGPPSRLRALRANAGNIASFDEPLRLAARRGIALAHLHTAGRIGGAVRTAMRHTGRPYVLSLHGPVLSSRQWLDADVADRRRRTVDLGKPIGALFGARRVIQDAARVIAFNDEERDALAEHIGDRAVRMDHGVDSERIAAGDARRGRARWNFIGQAPVLVVIGRLSAQKNQLLAVRAFAHGAPADHRLLLAGAETDGGYRERIEAEARALGVADRVHVLGNVDARRGVPDLLAMARLVLVPSAQETFGLSVLEGWAAGRPVLFARHSGLRDLGRALALDPDVVMPNTEVEPWAGAIARLCEEPDRRQARAHEGLRLVRCRFDWEIVSDRLSELYETAVEERSAAAPSAPRFI